jgi:hypothetical protein
MYINESSSLSPVRLASPGELVCCLSIHSINMSSGNDLIKTTFWENRKSILILSTVALGSFQYGIRRLYVI